MLGLPATPARLVGNPGIEPGMHTGAGFTGPLSHQTWRYPWSRWPADVATSAGPRSIVQLGVPVEEVLPGLVQEVRRKQPLRSHQVVHRRLPRRPQRRHDELVLLRVTGAAGRHDVLPARGAAAHPWNDVIERQILKVLPATILAAEAIAQKHVESGKGNARRRPDVIAQRDHRRQPHRGRRASHHLVVFGNHGMRALDHRLDRILPMEQRQRKIAQRLKVGVQHKRRICGKHGRLLF